MTWRPAWPHRTARHQFGPCLPVLYTTANWAPGYVLSSYLQLGSPRRWRAVPPPSLKRRVVSVLGSRFPERRRLCLFGLPQPPGVWPRLLPWLGRAVDRLYPPTGSYPCWRRRSTGQTLQSGSQASPCHPQRGPSWCPGQVCAAAGSAGSLLGLPSRALAPRPVEEGL